MIILNSGKFLFKALTKFCCAGKHVVSLSSAGNPGDSTINVFLAFVKVNDFIAKRQAFFIMGDEDDYLSLTCHFL